MARRHTLRWLLLVHFGAGMAVACVCGGCSKGTDQGVDKRVAETIKQLEQNAPQGHPALPYLKNANAESLTVPHLVFAQAIRTSSRLWVSWVEGQPSVDGIRITSTDRMFSCDLLLDGSHRRENEKGAKDSVLFSAIWIYDPDSSDWQRVDPIEPSGISEAGKTTMRGLRDRVKEASVQSGYEVALIRKGQVVSNAVSLELIGVTSEPVPKQ